jgi:HK97 family phage prohead protease
MPFPNFHSCRVRNPDDFESESFRTIDSDVGGKPVRLVIARPKGQLTTSRQAYRYPIEHWTEEQARGHCEQQDGTFEAATGGAAPEESEGYTPPGGVPPVLPQPPWPNIEASERKLRFTPGDVELEVEVRGPSRSPVIRGYAAVFYDGTPATEFRLADDLVERVLPTAFDRALDGTDDVVALFNHNKDNLLGRQSAGTLQLAKDERGLSYVIRPPDTTVARDLVENLRHRNVTGSSFSFDPRPDGRRWSTDRARKIDVIELTGVQTFDVGPVVWPAYKASSVEVASCRAELAGIRGLAGRLRGYLERATMIARGR